MKLPEEEDVWKGGSKKSREKERLSRGAAKNAEKSEKKTLKKP